MERKKYQFLRGHPAIKLATIGVINSPFKEPFNVPIQPAFSKARGRVEVFNKYAAGLKDIEGFSHIIIIYHFHECGKARLVVKPFLDRVMRGVFATRHPGRPNHIGLSVVRLVRRRGNLLHVEGLDVLDKTPLLDIKPYVPDFDETKRADVRIGWLEGKLE